MKWLKFFCIQISVVVFISVGLFSCTNVKEKVEKSFSLTVDVSAIPADTIVLGNVNLTLNNGIYYLYNKAFSGVIKEVTNNKTTSIGSYLNGMQHGISLTFFPNEQLRDSRTYKDGKAYGKHFGFWENGNKKFEFLYINDKREGENKQWYKSGKPYTFLMFKDDKENGMQQAWRENGKIYINYEVKDGKRYGLQKSALCYTLIDEKMKLK